MKHQRKSRVIGVDFDGILNRLFPPMQLIMYNLRPGDIWERSHLGKLRHFIIKTYAYLPFSPDGRIIDKLPRTVFIISGRIIRSSNARKLLGKYGFRFFFFRPYESIGEFEWKLRMCKLLSVTEFYDDRSYIVEKLRENGIDARLWRKE